MTLEQAATPCLLLDRGRLSSNGARMRARIAALGPGLRPHVKTLKSIDALRWVQDAGDGAITVSTLKEAEYFAAHGINDILYAVAIAPGRADQAAAIRKTGVDLTVVLDSLEAVRVLEAAARLQGVVMPALIEIDSDGHRSGVQPHDDLLIAIGRALAESDAVELRGVMTHAGESYACRSVAALVAMAEQERERAVFCAERLRAAGLECPVVSVGSTPTATFAAKLDGVTEVRAGVYMVNDLVMAGLGVARTDDIALSVLTTVIGHQPGQNRVIIDAGWMALSRDRGTASQAIDHGYGQVCDLRGSPLDELIVSDANQEHGIVTRRDGGAVDFAALPIGARLRILPNHACATAAQHDRDQVLDDGTIVGQWPRIRGW